MHKSNLDFPIEHRKIDPADYDSVLLKSKGFGGNNATGAILSPAVTKRMLTKRHGDKAMAAHQALCEGVTETAANYDNKMINEGVSPIYQFGKGVIQGEELTMSPDSIEIPGFPQKVSLDIDNPYKDMV